MRHRTKRAIKLTTHQTKSNVVRNLLTSLITHGSIKTTVAKARTLKRESEKMLHSLVSLFDKYEDDKDVRREAIRIAKNLMFSPEAGKKLVNDILPKYKESGKTTWFVQDFKLGPRPGDNAEMVLVKLV